MTQGQPVGTVQFGNIGDLCKNMGIFPLNASTPSDFPQDALIVEEKYTLPQVFYNGDPSQPQNHITIDDGARSYRNYLEQILNLAQEKGQKLTFFLIGSEMITYPDLVRRIWGEGHGLENHTLNHPRLTECTDTEIRRQIQEQKKISKEIIGNPLYQQKFLRPPYGDGIFNKDPRIPIIAKQEGLKIAMWSIDNGSNVTKTINDLKKGSIVLQHVTPNDFSILNQLLNGTKDKGFSSVPLEIYN